MAARTIAGETLLVPLRRGLADCDRIFILNEVGAFLWQALDGRDDRDALVRRIEGEFDTAPGADLGRDVDAFLAALDERGLITWEPRG